MIEKEREEDDVQDKQQDKQQGDSEDSGQSGIHKYFGKSNKVPKFFNPKIKKTIKSGPFQNLSLLVQSNLKNQSQFDRIHNKTKLKFEYRGYSNILNAKPKLKITLNPFNPSASNRLFQQILLNWKKTISKIQDQTYDIKLNDKFALSLKYKRTKYYMDKRLRHRFQGESIIDAITNPRQFLKGNLSFESLLKIPFYDKHQYLNSGEFKSKFSMREIGSRDGKKQFKFDFMEKLTFLIKQYKLKQQSKLNLTLLRNQESSLKSNIQITNPANNWTFYGSIFGKKWGVVFDQAKLLYNVYKDWKLGLMYGQKNSWQISLQNLKMNKALCTSFGIHVGNKNYAVILKNRFNRKQFGKINYELVFQNAINNHSFEKANVGIMVNVNL